MMQMAFTAFMMNNCKSSVPGNPFQHFSDSDNDSDEKHSGSKTKHFVLKL